MVQIRNPLTVVQTGGGASPFNATISNDISSANARRSFIGDFIQTLPEIEIGSSVVQVSFTDDVAVLAPFNNKKLKLVGGGASLGSFNQLATFYSSNGGFGVGEIDLSELTVKISTPSPVVYSYLSQNNVHLTRASLPSMEHYGSINNAFNGCTACTFIDMGGVINQGNENYTFHNTAALETLIIRNTTGILVAGGTDFLTGSGIESGICTIYVPDSLVASYKADSVWGTYSSQIKALSELPS